MSGPYGPNDPNGQWAQGQQPGGGDPDQTGGQHWGPQYGQQPPPGQPWGMPAPGQPPYPGQQSPGQQPQWGPPPQPQWGQQPGQQAPWGQPQQWGPPPGQQPWGPPPTSKNTKLPWIIAGAAALIVVVGVVVTLAFTVFRTDTLDQQAAEAGVERIVTDSYGAEDVSGVSCPSGQEVKKGNSFTCDLVVDGQDMQVTLTFTDDNGTYEVSRPS
ncbi:hypothetical protein BFN03_08310 [Rhodococcus sp. WMMA185]|uniref:DUF4333 domain-containing protein n=1 Tax=Rhodococcus sp. WMMA185 TaxID=679318 RepID=UPI0008787AEA|nr:DUF4333 domain-containing protein [Rhodococcus sp. WMMA185]AOW92703.1 hypothetical protein BFN03_08310 [Rhodococcus sp. WMMA185]